ncbi:alpha-mannosidase [Candidatus Sumerlaeota bacterium]|nr:alpha-mannosidase [Candidatus Sumerlaeota bacterium]
MLPPKADKRIEKTIQKLSQWRYAKISSIEMELFETQDHLRKPPRGAKYKPAKAGETLYGKAWGSAWLRGVVTIPQAYKGRRIYIRQDATSEKLLFINGKPVGSINSCHKEVLIAAKAKGGEKWRVDIEIYIGHPYPGENPWDLRTRFIQFVGCGHGFAPPFKLEATELLAGREAVAGLHYDAEALWQTARLLDDNSLRKAKIRQGLYDALNLIPLMWETDDELESGAKAARKALAPLLKAKNGPTTPFIGLAGHTHIDIAWLWPKKESIRKAARTFSTFLNLMNDYPELRFLQSQPALIQMIEDCYPEILPAIRKKVKEGNWEPNGGMWVEADCNVSSGEALVRQFLEGFKKTQEIFGYQSDTLWLPDVFGYSAALPQIMRQAEIVNFITSKINWNDTTRFPYDTFLWEGIDGTKIFSHYITSRSGGYNATVKPEEINGTWNNIQQKENQEWAIASVGHGDGGGGVTREMCEMARRLEDLEGCPKTGWINVSEFMDGLKKQCGKWPEWKGELYLELHRGTYTSQAKTKQWNRRLEFLLREVEWLCTMAMGCGVAYPAKQLERLWRVVLTNQFHDILPGSSIQTVYETTGAEYTEVDAELRKLREKAIQTIGARLATNAPFGKPYWIANALSWDRNEIIRLKETGASGAADAQGNALPCQRTREGALCVKAAAPGMGITTIHLTNSPAESATAPFKGDASKLETPFYKIRFDRSGRIASLVDKRAKRELVKSGGHLNALYSAEDQPINWDAWDIDLYYRDKITQEDRLQSSELIECGPLFATIKQEYAIGRRSMLTQHITVYADSPRIDFETKVDWRERHVLLKTGFALDVLTDQARCEIQYGHVSRNTHSNLKTDQAQFEICAHKWVDLSEEAYGVALLNDCKYGHDTLDGILSLTLLKSALAPDETADQGEQTFTYALLPHIGEFSVDPVVREAYALNQPLTVQKALSGKQDGAASVSFCSVDNPNVVLETIKKAEKSDAVIVRIYEAGRTRAQGTLTFTRPVKSAAICNLLERQDAPVKVKGGAIGFDLRPFEIRTYNVEFE